MNNLKLIYLVSFLEGAALMAAELLSAKIMAPYFGTSLTVWTSVFIITLSALATGYFVGAKLSTKTNPKKKLLYILLIASILFYLMFPISKFIMESTINLDLKIGSLISTFVFLFPLLLSFGIVSPLIVKIITQNIDESGERASLIYTISTIGGILATVIFGLNFIPDLGIKSSIYIASSLVLFAAILTYFIQKTPNNG
ncbi:MAG: fused MFS/spermidine synthase [Flavobacteriia bacterium]